MWKRLRLAWYCLVGHTVIYRAHGEMRELTIDGPTAIVDCRFYGPVPMMVGHDGMLPLPIDQDLCPPGTHDGTAI